MPERDAQFSSVHREVKVDRVVVNTTVVDMDYHRVELCIDGEEYEFIEVQNISGQSLSRSQFPTRGF